MKNHTPKIICFSVLVAAFLAGCPPHIENTFVDGTAPTYYLVDIPKILNVHNRTVIDKNDVTRSSRLIFFFNRCIYQDSLFPSDFELRRNASITDLKSCLLSKNITSGDLSKCMDNSQWEQVDFEGSYFDRFEWATTGRMAPEYCAPPYYDRVTIILRPDSLWQWPIGQSEPALILYELILKNRVDGPLMDEQGNVSNGTEVIQFLVADGTKDTEVPQAVYIFPALDTGIPLSPPDVWPPVYKDQLPYPFPPHYPIRVKLSETIINLSYVSSSGNFPDPKVYPPGFHPEVPPHKGYSREGKDFGLFFPKGLPPAVTFEMYLYPEPADYQSHVYDSLTGFLEYPDDYALMRRIPIMDLSGNHLHFAQSSCSSFEEYYGTGIKREVFAPGQCFDVPSYPKTIRFKTAPVRITGPAYDTVLTDATDLSSVIIQGENTQAIDRIEVTMDYWENKINDPEPGLGLKNPSVSLTPAYNLSLTTLEGDVRSPSLSGSGDQVVYWSGPDFFVYLRDFSNNTLTQVSDTGNDYMYLANAGPPSISDDGRRVAYLLYFRPLWSLHVWDGREASPREMPPWLISTYDDIYPPVLSGDGNVLYFISNANINGLNPSEFYQTYKIDLDPFPTTYQELSYATSIVQDGNRVKANLMTGLPNLSTDETGNYLAWIDGPSLNLLTPTGKVTRLLIYNATFLVGYRPQLLVGQKDGKNYQHVFFIDKLGWLYVDRREETDVGSGTYTRGLQRVTFLGLFCEGCIPVPFRIDDSETNLTYLRLNKDGSYSWMFIKPERVAGWTAEGGLVYHWEVHWTYEIVRQSNAVNDLDINRDGDRAVMENKLFTVNSETLPFFSITMQELGDLIFTGDNKKKCENMGLNDMRACLLPDRFHFRLRAKAYSGENYLGFDEIAIHYDKDDDYDNDGLANAWETTYGLDPLDDGNTPDGDIDNGPNGDPDRDGLINLDEQLSNCMNPTNPDTDNDLMPDGWEVLQGFQPCNPLDALDDSDGDGLNNLQEFENGTDPSKGDTDGDGLTDGAEVLTFFTDPLRADTDSDGLTDYSEVITWLTLPWDSDTDDDGIIDGLDLPSSLYPCLSPTNADSDNDGIPDGWEVIYGLNPCEALDANADFDNDGLINLLEYQLGSNPHVVDTDGDGDSDYVDPNPTDPFIFGQGIPPQYLERADCFGFGQE
ncbi:MAG: hypothetical protein A2V67_00330 [Deltaproteobacteria bacterium RBG_13_61_14]|nr:MAG: hypothetical protein A2V67_00330 [Deltaproteobacteria bacterium RBG_13_61_14]